MTRACFALLLTVACKPPVPIYNFHSVGTERDEFAIPVSDFERLVGQQHTISLHELAAGEFAPGDVVLTFDDGFEDALTTVLPILKARGMRGTFFIVTDWVGKPGFLDWAGIEKLRDAGMEIGSHTVDHARLAELREGRVESELRDSKRILQERLHIPIEAVAYPYNSVRAWIIDAARDAGYRIGVSGPLHGSGDPLNLARISIKR
jgi:peptidoglycan/xylan/chitin deacetylase (PgdA/CDA1 family)